MYNAARLETVPFFRRNDVTPWGKWMVRKVVGDVVAKTKDGRVE